MADNMLAWPWSTISFALFLSDFHDSSAEESLLERRASRICLFVAAAPPPTNVHPARVQNKQKTRSTLHTQFTLHTPVHRRVSQWRTLEVGFNIGVSQAQAKLLWSGLGEDSRVTSQNLPKISRTGDGRGGPGGATERERWSGVWVSEE